MVGPMPAPETCDVQTLQPQDLKFLDAILAEVIDVRVQTGFRVHGVTGILENSPSLAKNRFKTLPKEARMSLSCICSYRSLMDFPPSASAARSPNPRIPHPFKMQWLRGWAAP